MAKFFLLKIVTKHTNIKIINGNEVVYLLDEKTG